MSPTDSGANPAGRVTTVEIFFDLVFVFTVTQLTGVLERDLAWAGLGRIVLVLGLLWYPYTGYAWLTNQVPPRGPAQKLPLFVGMAGFLLTSVAIPGVSPTPGCCSLSGSSSSPWSTWSCSVAHRPASPRSVSPPTTSARCC
ncbi:low temperature requirement protein A [Micromonospora sp. ATA32]|nr:low temperature requirement protein A [Micromonospora sp. ATA32]